MVGELARTLHNEDMRISLWLLPTAGILAAGLVLAQAKYSGPRPPKPDVPFLLVLDKLTEIESGMATQADGKNEATYSVNGATSPVRTPMAEPIFLFQSEKINPETLSLFKMNVSGGKRTISIPSGRRAKNAPRPISFLTTPLGGGLFRIEVNEFIDNGEYCFSPDGSNQVFCFTTY